jgi:hypothetical protein
VKRALWILWPSFAVAGAASAVLVLFTDPAELPFDSVGFFFLWAVAAASSGFTWFLSRP